MRRVKKTVLGKRSTPLLTNLQAERYARRMRMAAKSWTLEELQRLPDDGNKYELIHGELFVTPAPSPAHEYFLAALTAALAPYVEANDLGIILHPRAVIRIGGNEVEPDLMVRHRPVSISHAWDAAPLPSLV